MNPLRKAIAAALSANDEIGEFFTRLGSSANQGGIITSAYSLATREMRTALSSEDRITASGEIMAMLSDVVENRSRALLTEATERGLSQADKQLRAYHVKRKKGSVNLSEQVDSAINAIVARVAMQSATIAAMVMTGAEDDQITGTEDRTGVMRWSDVTVAAAFWSANLFWSAFDRSVSQFPQFKKQAIAALYSKTTDCCLRVHAQIQPLNSPFILTGYPRYADEMEYPGFHRFCRTSVALYQAVFDDGITKSMRDGADEVLAERAGGVFVDRRPANAFS